MSAQPGRQTTPGHTRYLGLAWLDLLFGVQGLALFAAGSLVIFAGRGGFEGLVLISLGALFCRDALRVIFSTSQPAQEPSQTSNCSFPTSEKKPSQEKP